MRPSVALAAAVLAAIRRPRTARAGRAHRMGLSFPLPKGRTRRMLLRLASVAAQGGGRIQSTWKERGRMLPGCRAWASPFSSTSEARRSG